MIKSSFKKYLENVGVTKREIYVLIFVLVLILSVPVIITLFFPKGTFGNSGIIGDTFGGLTAPLLSFFGSVLVYFALKSQISANKLITDQFEEQNQDQIFFQLYEDLQVKRNMIRYTSSAESTGMKALINLNESIIHMFTNRRTAILGFLYFSTKIKDLSTSDLDVLRENTERFHPRFITIDKFREIIKDLTVEDFFLLLSSNSKKYPLSASQSTSKAPFELAPGFVLEDGAQITNSFISLGSVHFYEFPYVDKKNIYSYAYSSVTSRGIYHLNDYFTLFEYLLDQISKSKEIKQLFFNDYLFINLSEYERLILLFYSSAHDDNLSKKIKKFYSKRQLDFNPKLFFRNPSTAQLENEIEQILSI